MQKKLIEKILVITPHEEDRDLICEKLKELQFRFFAVQTYESIMQALERESFHYFFIDTRKNDQYSPDVLQTISKKNPDAAIISIIRNKSPHNTVQSFISGVDNILLIPYELERLPVILAQTKERKRYTQDIRNHISGLEHRAVNSEKALEHSFDIVEQTLVDTIKTFVGLMETRSIHIGSHSKHVGPIARAVAERYDLKERVKRDIEIGGLLHDIGKIGFSDQILKKTHTYFPSVDLTNKERQLYQKHPVIGQEAVAMVNILNQVGLYIRHHHERFDGSGYPDGLSGFHIPLGARIINIVDAFEKIVYTVEKSKQKDAQELFVKYLKKHKGRIFDPEASDKLLGYMKEVAQQEKEAEHRVSIEKLIPGMSLARDLYTKNGVLVISRFETITTGEIKRLARFLHSDMIMDSVYVHMPTQKKMAKPRDVSGKNTVAASVEETNFAVVKKKIDTTKDYSTLLEIHDAVTQFISNGKSTRDDIADILKRDPVITMKILRIANSPLLGFRSDISSVEEGVKRLGFAEIRHVIDSVPVLEENGSGSSSMNRRELWRHHIAVGIICRLIGKRIGAVKLDEYFTAGILHDFGKMILDQLFHEQYMHMLGLVSEKAIFYRKAERMLFGNTHVEIGLYLMRKWNIPATIIDAIQNHHTPMDSREDQVLTSAVHLADIIAHMLQIGKSGENTVPKYEPLAQQKLRISLADLESFIPDIDDELKQSKELLFV